MKTRSVLKGAVTIAALALASAGCTLKDQDPPPLAGPSELGLAIRMTATPDVVTQDGASQSTINIEATDAAGQPVRNLSLRLEMAVNNSLGDFGRLSQTTVVTDNAGQASVVYTAPPAPAGFGGEMIVQVIATPIGTDYANAVARWVNIRLVQPGTIYSPGSPIAQFTFSPTNPKIGTLVLFDGTVSSDPDGFIVRWEWNWGDGDPIQLGRHQDHDYFVAGTFTVTLTVIDNDGKRASTSRAITVTP